MRLKDLSIVHKEGGLEATNWLWRASMIIGIAAFAVYCVGFGTSHWMELDDEPARLANASGTYYDKHSGLWRRCLSFKNSTTGKEISGYCENVGNSRGYRVTAKIMCTVGLIATFVGLLGSLISGLYNSSSLQGVSGFLVLAGGIVSGIGSSVLLGKSLDDDDDIDPGYSAFLAIFGNIVTIIMGVLLLCSIRRGYNSIA